MAACEKERQRGWLWKDISGIGHHSRCSPSKHHLLAPGTWAHHDRSFYHFFNPPATESAAPQMLGFDGFFKGAYSYHFHNFWYVGWL